MLFFCSPSSVGISHAGLVIRTRFLYLFLTKLEPLAGDFFGNKTRIRKYYGVCVEGDMNKIWEHSHSHFMNHS